MSVAVSATPTTTHASQSASRTMSPASVTGSIGKPLSTDEERRDMLARQRAALYNGPSMSSFDNAHDDPLGRSASSTSIRALSHSPGMEGSVEKRSRANSNASPATFNHGAFDTRTGSSSPTGRDVTSTGLPAPPTSAPSSTSASSAGISPIGTRPPQSQAANPAIGSIGGGPAAKRSTTPQQSSPLTFGYKSDAKDSAPLPQQPGQTLRTAPGMGVQAGVW